MCMTGVERDDTTCVQWFIVEDHQPPRVMSLLLDDAWKYYPNIDIKLRAMSSRKIKASMRPSDHMIARAVQLPDVREFVERSVGQYLLRMR